MKKLTLIIGLLIVIFSCNKQNDFVSPKHDDDRNIMSLYQSPSRIINDSLITEIGVRHNQILEEAINNINWNSASIEQELNIFFLNYIDPSIDSLITNRSEMGLVISNTDNYLSENLNPSVYQMMIDCKDFIYQMPNYSNIVSQLNLYRDYSNNTFVGSDLDIALVFLEVTEKSAYFWMPSSIGGSGIGWGFIEDYCDENDIEVAAINWGQIGWADGAGAAGVLLRTWYLAGCGPLSWGAIVGAIGWGAAWGSGMAILGQLMF